MIEKCNPSHPDKLADRVCGAIVDLAYKKTKDPKIAVEALIGHGSCTIIAESSVCIEYEEVVNIVKRIAGSMTVNFNLVPQDVHLAENQSKEIRCGDNGIFKGVPLTYEQKKLSEIARKIYEKYPTDGKYILDFASNKLIVCQSCAKTEELKKLCEELAGNLVKNIIVNPLGEWVGGTDTDTGAVNRKLGSDMADSATGGGLCLSGDSEYLGEDLKWHRMDQYENGKVAQWNNGTLEFVNPLKYIHNINDKLIYIHNDSKLSMCLTPYHEVLIETSKNNLIKKPASLIAEKLSEKVGNSGKIIHNFFYQNNVQKSEYKDDTEYRLQVAFCADGTLLGESNKKWNGRIRVKKQYKKDRLRELLKGKNYKETQNEDYSIFWYKFTKPCKSLYECFKNENWDILKDEVFKWDGNERKKLFRTTKKEDADFIQFVLQSYGNSVKIIADDRVGRKRIVCDKEYIQKSTMYTVSPYASNRTSLRASKGIPITVEYLNEKQDSYCFEVPSHNLIIRHNDKIFITGNCGKDLSKADVSVNIYAFLKAQELNKTVKLCCAIGDDTIDGRPYSEIVEIARDYINKLGGFEKFAEWGLF